NPPMVGLLPPAAAVSGRGTPTTLRTDAKPASTGLVRRPVTFPQIHSSLRQEAFGLPIVFPAGLAGKIVCKKCLILLDQKRRSSAAYAVPPKADIGNEARNVRFAPKTDIHNFDRCCSGLLPRAHEGTAGRSETPCSDESDVLPSATYWRPALRKAF